MTRQFTSLQKEVDEPQPHLPQRRPRVAAVLARLQAAARARPPGVEDQVEVVALVEGAEEAELEAGGLAVDDLVDLGRQLVRHRLVLGPPQHPPGWQFNRIKKLPKKLSTCTVYVPSVVIFC